MKKSMSLLLALCMVFMLMPFGASAAKIVDSGTCGKDGDNLTWTLDADGLLRISGTGEMGDFVEYTINSYETHYIPVKCYVPPWNHHCDEIRSVVIDPGVTSIADEAFSGCSSMRSVEIPDSVTSIGREAFNRCSDLRNITLPTSVTRICTDAFTGTGVSDDRSNWTDGVLYIGSALIDAKYDVGSCDVKDGTTVIADYAFSDWLLTDEGYRRDCLDGWDYSDDRDPHVCSLYRITIPESVKHIGAGAFYDTRLESVTIPASVESIGEAAFSRTPLYEDESNWSDGVLYLGSALIKAKEAVTSHNIKDGTTVIADRAFADCGELTSVEIPESVTSVGLSAFENCGKLTSVVIPESVTSIEDYTFQDCSGLTSVTISEGVKSIGRYAFACCSKLTSVEIPESVTSVAPAAFVSCESLDSIHVQQDNAGYSAKDGILYNKAQTALLCCPENKKALWIFRRALRASGMMRLRAAAS